eukprot:TRINITY_DN2963_c0_g1_i1.p1 TRINITY_DN2963_c0_g1~~TRINITY_DN2963_c0_g1_i1.p1  ORF type:complete len:377 (+),score=51.30 TRINITY_DN2963_c0_g1_i1:41-1171(+)
MAEEETVGLVIDCGAGLCRAGFAGDEAPRGEFTAVVGVPSRRGTYAEPFRDMSRDIYVAGDAECRREHLQLVRPVQQGLIQNWDYMEKLWHHAFYNELRVAPEEHPVLLSESIFNPPNYREKITQIMFEVFSVPSLCLANSARLSLLSSGRYTGVVVESGKDLTSVVPIFDGYSLPNCTARLNLGGRHLSDHFRQWMGTRGYTCQTAGDAAIFNHMKETKCEVAMTLNPEPEETIERYELPSGHVLEVGNERYRCPEAMFRPELVGLEEPGLHQLTNWSIQTCEVELRSNLYVNIILSGGNTMFRGFAERLETEIQTLAHQQWSETRVKVIAPPERKYSVWIGGSIMASLSTFKETYISKAMYEENGPTIVHRKCF